MPSSGLLMLKPFPPLKIQFDDGDSLEYVSRRSIITESKYRTFFGREPPPLPSAEIGEELEASHVITSLTPREMYTRRCGQCELCTKPDCGVCSTCRNNKRAASNDDEREVCLQKVGDHMTGIIIVFSFELC